MNRAAILVLVLAGSAGAAAYFGDRGPETATTVVTVSGRGAEAPVRAPVLATPKSEALPTDTAALARQLQRELKRVGCYDGQITGVWTTSTRVAMKTFTDRVNASLPIEKPDYVLLSLVQAHPDRVCGTPCPVGQVASQDGRCLPEALVHSAARDANDREEAKAVERRLEMKPATVKAEETKPAEAQATKPAEVLVIRPTEAQATKPAEAQAAKPAEVPVQAKAAEAAKEKSDGAAAATAAAAGAGMLATAAIGAAPAAKPEARTPDAGRQVAVPHPQAPDTSAAQGDRPRRAAAHHEGPVPPEGVYKRKPRRTSERDYHQPPKFVRSFLRSVERMLDSLGR